MKLSIPSDHDYYEELLEKKENYQCIFCGGWALTCPCKSNMFSEKEKKDVQIYLAWREHLNIKNLRV